MQDCSRMDSQPPLYSAQGGPSFLRPGFSKDTDRTNSSHGGWSGDVSVQYGENDNKAQITVRGVAALQAGHVYDFSPRDGEAGEGNIGLKITVTRNGYPLGELQDTLPVLSSPDFSDPAKDDRRYMDPTRPSSPSQYRNPTSSNQARPSPSQKQTARDMEESFPSLFGQKDSSPNLSEPNFSQMETDPYETRPDQNPVESFQSLPDQRNSSPGLESVTSDEVDTDPDQIRTTQDPLDLSQSFPDQNEFNPTRSSVGTVRLDTNPDQATDTTADEERRFGEAATRRR